MPKIRPLTKKQRDEQAIEREIQRAADDFLRVINMKRGLEGKTYSQVSEDIGVSRTALQSWRLDGKLQNARFGRVVTVYAKMGYRLVPEPIQGCKTAGA